MLSPNPRVGFYEADTSRALDRNGGNPACNQGGVAVCVRDSAACYSMTTGGFAEIHEEKASTLMARDYKDPQLVARPRYVARRLTPLECGRLQGFPDWWCDGLETAEPSEDEIGRWVEVFEKHRRIAGNSEKSRSRAQIVKWLRDPYSDSAAYKMWGNGVALPCVCFVMAGIMELVKSEEA